MKRIVFIVGSYYPYPSAVGKCLGNVAQELSKDNQVTVICEKVREGEPESECINGHAILRVTTNRARRRRAWEKASSQHGLHGRFGRIGLALHRLGRLIRTVLAKNSVYGPTVRAYQKALEQIGGADCIIPTCMPFETVVAAMGYQEVHPNVILAPFLFDKFALNETLHRTNWNRKLKMRRHLKLEEQMLQKSEKVLFVPSWKEHLEGCFPAYREKLCEAEHPLLKPPVHAAQAEPVFPTDCLNLVYTGVVDKSIRPPQAALRLLASACTPELNAKVHFYVLGNAVEQIEDYAKRYPALVINHGSVAAIEAGRAVAAADVLLSLGNTDINQMPSKLFEYMAQGKPIVHFSLRREDPAQELLLAYPLALCLDSHADAAQTASDLKQFLRTTRKERIPFSTVEALFPKACPAYSAKIIENL